MQCLISFSILEDLVLFSEKDIVLLTEYHRGKTQATFLENDTKKINALLWFKTWKCFKLKLLQLKICHLYWNHKTREHHPTSTHTSKTSFLLLFGLCQLLTLLLYNPPTPTSPIFPAEESGYVPFVSGVLTESVMTKLWEF